MRTYKILTFFFLWSCLLFILFNDLILQTNSNWNSIAYVQNFLKPLYEYSYTVFQSHHNVWVYLSLTTSGIILIPLGIISGKFKISDEAIASANISLAIVVLILFVFIYLPLEKYCYPRF